VHGTCTAIGIIARTAAVRAFIFAFGFPVAAKVAEARRSGKPNHAKMKIKIVKKMEKPFKGSDGDMVPYFWYTFTDPDGVQREAGSALGEGVEGETYLGASVVKVERRNGKTGWKIEAFEA